MKCSDFRVGNWSFRYRPHKDGRHNWEVYPKGERSHWSHHGSITAASDNATFIVWPRTGAIDARPTFEAALEIMLSRLTGKIA
jgi:hypothetical protein